MRIGEIIDNTPDKKAIFDAMGLALSLGMAVDPEKSYTDWVAAEELAARIAALKKRAEAGDADAELELQELYEELDEKEAGKKK